MSTLHKLLTDERFYLENLIVIEDRNKQLRPFVLNPAQELIYNSATGRDLVIKAGQLGVTTLFLAKGLRKCLTEQGTTAVVVAHEEFLTQRLLHRVQSIYDKIPSQARATMHHSSANEKSFPGLNSVFYIGTAGAKVFGRGEPIHYFLGSEVAFWPDAKRILDPTMQRVPLSGEIILESTPNGTGDPEHPDPSKHNTFYDLVREARDDPDSPWQLHALHWWLEPEYRLVKGHPRALKSDQDKLSYTAEEENLIRLAKWDDTEAEERIRWRRLKIKGIKAAFWQEYMEDIESCFLVAGMSYYDTDELARLAHGCFPAPYHLAGAQVWQLPVAPEDNPVYSLTVDPGQGKTTRSVAQVWRHDLDDFSRVQHCATLAGFYDTITFAPMVLKLAELYYNPKLVSEANGHGMSFCSEIKYYPNLYYRTSIISGVPTKEIGWYTTGSPKLSSSGTKPYMMNELNQILSTMECYDINIIRELQQVRVLGDRVKFLSSDDYHDTAAMMAATRVNPAHIIQKGFVGTSGWSR